MIETRPLYTYKNAAIGPNKGILRDIHLPSKNIAIYKRNIDSLKTELFEIAAKTIEFRAKGKMEEIRKLLEEYLCSHQPGFPALFRDAFALLELFEEITQASSFGLLLTTVNTDMCRRFHTDINDLRLLCTYVGPGTLWVPDEVVDFESFSSKRDDPEKYLDPQQIQRVQTGDVAILKGALYPEAEPILHRSPAIEEQEEKRLLLRIDTGAAHFIF